MIESGVAVMVLPGVTPHAMGKTCRLPDLEQIVCAVAPPISSRWYARSLPDHDHVCAVPDRKESLEVGKCAQKVKIGERA